MSRLHLPKTLVRFWSKVNKNGPLILETPCWQWIAGNRGQGYGQFWFSGKDIRAHRFSWGITNGSIPDEMQVLHRCDNPPCVNPEHLFLGTYQDNMNDKTNKVRQARGSKQGLSKLTEAQVVEIRQKYVPYVYSAMRLANEYGVSETAIFYIINKKFWKHI